MKMTENIHIPAIIKAEEIQSRIGELAQEIETHYAEKSLFLLGVALGGLPFMNDLSAAMSRDYPSGSVRIQSYTDTESSREPVFLEELPGELNGQDVLIVDDIYDTGNTLSALIKKLEQAGAASVRVCVLLTKSRAHECSVEIAYGGFDFPDVFAVGYGLDYNGEYRDLPFIGELPESAR